MIRRRFVIGETCIDACTDERFMDGIPDLIAEARGIIESKIDDDSEFAVSLEPIEVKDGDHLLIKRMCSCSALADVGPMAGVAGAVGTYVLEALVGKGCTYAILDNGGDIAMISDREVSVGLFTGRAETSRIKLRFPPTDGILGICSSSAYVGHSLSLGRSDIATVVSRDVILADACATRLGNMVQDEAGLQSATEHVAGIQGIIGCLASIGSKIAVCGDIPEIEI